MDNFNEGLQEKITQLDEPETNNLPTYKLPEINIEESASTVKVAVTAKKLNVRPLPEDGSLPVVGIVDEGVILEGKFIHNGAWFKTIVFDKKGFVKAEFVKEI